MDEKGWGGIVLYCIVVRGIAGGGFFGRELVCADEGYWW